MCEQLWGLFPDPSSSVFQGWGTAPKQAQSFQTSTGWGVRSCPAPEAGHSGLPCGGQSSPADAPQALPAGSLWGPSLCPQEAGSGAEEGLHWPAVGRLRQSWLTTFFSHLQGLREPRYHTVSTQGPWMGGQRRGLV